MNDGISRPSALASIKRVSTYVLIHGNWHGGSAWAGVRKALELGGYRSIAPTLPGHGKDAPRHTTYGSCTQSIVDLVVSADLTDIVLVGHSGGAIFSSKVAEEIPERIRRMVFVSGVVLEDGQCLMDASPPQYRPAFQGLATDSGDNTVAVPYDMWAATFINDGDQETARRAYEQLSPESFDLMLESVDLKRFCALDIPLSYLLPTEDIVFPPGEWGWQPRMTDRLGPHRFLEMPGSHEVMFTNPAGLAHSIVDAARD